MKILGNRVLVSKIEEMEQNKNSSGFTSVEVQDSFLYKGRVEQLGVSSLSIGTGSVDLYTDIKEGDIIYFAKYSPHTQTIEDMKVIRMEDVIAVV